MAETRTPSFCPKCGTGVAPDDRFCRSCGLDLASLATDVPVASSPDVAAPGLERSSGWATAEPGWQTVAPRPSLSTTPAGTSQSVSPEPVKLSEAVAKGRNRAPLLVGLGVLVVIGAAAVAVLSGAISTPLNTHTIAGTFELKDSSGTSSIDQSGSSCRGIGGYSDVAAGTNVTVKDERGVLLDTTSLGAGSGNGVACTFSFTLTVPDAVKFYTFEVGRRGELSYSHDDMVGYGWTVGMTLGSN